jgi:CxxC motif-containing protein (DUF1111 family)
VYPYKSVTAALGISVAVFCAPGLMQAQTDPGLRGGGAGAGGQISGMGVQEYKFFSAGQSAFGELHSVSGSSQTEQGLGPRFNLSSCAGCHAAPASGGSSPALNPQVSAAPFSQVNPLVLLNIINGNGPVREVRFKSDGGVHDLFTIMGRSDTPPGCNISQPDFASHVAASDVIFRIPTPVFGAGLIEAIPDAVIAANETSGKPFGITGHSNRSGNDGTITRFGWKAQNKSLVIFSGEAYNVEQGVTNDLFPDERGEAGVQDPLPCRIVPAAQDHTNYQHQQPTSVPSDAVNFANFMRFLAPPAPVSSFGSVTSASINNGRAQFINTGCAACHTPSMQTGNHSSPALANQPVNLFSDLLVHNMGLLGDGIGQGNAGPNEFRTAPLWGLGQRIFFLHDGRTSDLLEAIGQHAARGTDPSSEANAVIIRFNALSATDKQNILNFLRSL